MLLGVQFRMNYTENALNVLVAKSCRGIGKSWIVKNFGGGEAVDDVVSLLNDSSRGGPVAVDWFEANRAALRGVLDGLAGFADGVIAIGDAGFPPCRGNVKGGERPVCLLYRGDLGLLQSTNRNVAVIGLRGPDGDTETLEQEIVAELVGNGATIVSGLALGCDTIAHRQALDSGGKTVAILPSPLNDVMPETNRGLADEIAEGGGLLISEYHEGPKSREELGGRYQERDRLQALFSDCVVLTASYAKNNRGDDSGSRHAMQYALDYSILRAVIYDDKVHAGNAMYDLNRQVMGERDDVVVMNRSNLASAVERVMASRPRPSTVSEPVQADLLLGA